jgi:hypothetical protein
MLTIPRTITYIAACAAFLLLGAVCSVQESHARPDSLEKAWELFTPKPPSSGANSGITPKTGDPLGRIWERYIGTVILPEKGQYPGRCIGDDPALAAFAKVSRWQYRSTSYELYFASSQALARSIYGLAMHSGDVDRAMQLERFEKGVRGFHYSIAQLCAWFNAVLSEQMPVHTTEERQFILCLLQDGAVNIVNGSAVPGTNIHHVLGAAPGKKRAFEASLVHERLHVLWDEDPNFATTNRTQWNTLGEDEKQEARKRLAA